MRANPSTQLKKITLALGLTFIVASSAHAAGLGKLTVLSSLGRPLRAEIEITAVTPNDANQLAAKLANAKLFSDAHVELVPDLSLMNFAIEQRDDQYYVLITSKKAINEPYIEFLVELTSASGRIVREYSMLIDQADAHSSPADNPSIAEKGASVDADPSDIMPPVSVAAKPTHKAVEAQASTHYKVKRGDTLSKIASRYKAKGVTLDQMLIALQKSNPAVFIQGNINLIPAGVMLNIPSAKDIADVDRHEASLSVAAQAMDFEAFRQRLAQHIASSQAQENQASKKIDANKIGSKPPELATDSNQPQDKLEISKVHQPNQNTSDEDTVAKQKALEEAKARVAELE
jgi:pilus assembly protein FimV